MMTKDEARAFRENPGPPGVYRFQSMTFTNKVAKNDRLRKWNGSSWGVGVDESPILSEKEWIRRALGSSMLRVFEMLEVACVMGRTPYLFTDLAGNKCVAPPIEVAKPDQLDFFDFN